MNIIGCSADNDTYIVQLNRGELSNILGFRSPYDDDFKSQLRLALRGNPISVSKVYNNYCKVKSIVKSSPYDKAITKLEEMIEALKPIDKLIEELEENYEANQTKF